VIVFISADLDSAKFSFYVAARGHRSKKLQVAKMQLLLCLSIWLLKLSLALAEQIPIIPTIEADPEWTTALIQLHQRLVEIESISGREKEVGEWLENYLDEQGLTVERQHVSPDRFNVLAYPGTDRNKKVLVTSHIDTVSKEATSPATHADFNKVPPYIPYSTSKDESEIWGRGSVDAKASVAAQIIATLKILKPSQNSVPSNSPSLALLFVVGEETAGDGMLFFSDHKPANYSAVLFGEPTESKLVSGHKGMLSFVLNITGKAAHSGYPWLGLSANSILVQSLSKLLDLEKKLPQSDKLGETTLNIGQVEGGVAANVVAEGASAKVSIRIAAGTPGEIRSLVADALEPIKSRTLSHGGGFDISWSNRAYGPVHCDTDIEGFPIISVNYGTDVPNLSGDYKKYLFGPGTICK
jgi:acetylornithine deacetylase